MAAKRGIFPPELEDLEICVATGWSFTELRRQSVQDVERILIYLSTLSEKQRRESEELKHQTEMKLSRLR
jgi:hypothetical protein